MKRVAAAALMMAAMAAPACAAGDDPHMRAGAEIYRDTCQACHGPDGKGDGVLFPPLAGNSLLAQASAQSLAQMVLAGAQSPQSKAAPTGAAMPSFAWRLTDQQVADVLTFVRSGWNNAAPVSASTVASVRRSLRRKP